MRAGEPAAVWQRRAIRLGIALAVVVCLLGSAFTLFAMRKTDWYGDEYTYVAAARQLALLATGKAGFSDATAQIVIGPGWFMPGMAIVGAPLFVVLPDASQLAIRAWFCLVNLALWAGLVRSFARKLGPPYLIALLIFPTLAANWSVLTAGAFPDLTAGILGAYALLAAYRIGLGLLRGTLPGWGQIARFEAWSVLALYVRGPQIVVVLATHALLIALALAVAGARGKAIGRIVAGLMLFALCLAPWSVLISRHLGAPVLTTSNVPLVLADSFGDPARTCFGRCPPPGDDIWPAYHYARRQARASGANELTVERAMMRNSLAGLTPGAYLAKVRQHFGTFLFDPAGTLRLYLPAAYAIPKPLRGAFYTTVSTLTWLVYAPFLLALFVANLAIFRSGPEARLQSLLIKLATGCLFLQPFVHKCSGRYWVTFAPLAAWSAALIVTALLDRRAATVSGQTRWLDRAQTAYAIIFAAAMITVLLA